MQGLNRQKKQKFIWLQEFYPSVAIYLMKRTGMKNKLRGYMENCKKFVDGARVKSYSKYIHGWLIPQLQIMRESGQIQKGMFFIFDNFLQVSDCFKSMVPCGNTSENQTLTVMHVVMGLQHREQQTSRQKALGLEIKDMAFVSYQFQIHCQFDRCIYRLWIDLRYVVHR